MFILSRYIRFTMINLLSLCADRGNQNEEKTSVIFRNIRNSYYEDSKLQKLLKVHLHV